MTSLIICKPLSNLGSKKPCFQNTKHFMILYEHFFKSSVNYFI